MIHNNIRHKEHNNKHKQMQNRYEQHNKTVIKKSDCTLPNHAQYVIKVTIYTSKSCKYKNKLDNLNSNLSQYHTRNIIKNTKQK